MSYKKFAQDLYAVASQLDALGKRGLADRVDGIANKIISSAAPRAVSDELRQHLVDSFLKLFPNGSDKQFSKYLEDIGMKNSGLGDTRPGRMGISIPEEIKMSEMLQEKRLRAKMSPSPSIAGAVSKVKPSPAGIGHMPKGKAAAIIAAVGVAAAAIAGYFMQSSNDSERLDTEMQALKAMVERAADKDDAAVNRIADYGLLKVKDIRGKIGKEPGYEAAPEQMQALRSLEKALVEIKDDIAMD
jgi:hypothetical protein